MSFYVESPGFFTTIQDRGRFGLGHKGLSDSGVADLHAASWANQLLDNSQECAVLEITFGGCELKVLNDTMVAITGADFALEHNGRSVANWRSFFVRSGDKLRWRSGQHGMRSYLAVKDGFQTEVYFNSRSVTVREGIGKSISKGDIVRCSDLSQIQQQTRSVPEQFIPDYTSTLTLHLLPSYQFQRFSKQQKHTFFNQVYEIDHGSDRTGCRLSGEPIVEVPHALISEGIAYGSVEITSAGQPIILLNDRPTIGGYPKIGTVFSLDLFALAQRQAGDMVMFELIDIDTVQTRRREFNGFFNL